MTPFEHDVAKRHTGLGRWFPLCLYLVNAVLWLITGILADTPDVWWLAGFPAATSLLYIVRTRRMAG